MSNRAPVIALDGPAGAGKSSVSKALASALGLGRVDTGAMYRSVAFAALRAEVSWDAGALLGELTLALVKAGDLRLKSDESAPGGTKVTYRGEDISAAIRTPELSQGASQVSRHLGVREALVAWQRQLADEGGVILEGRDIGTVVLPRADIKFFLTASPEERARRRYRELQAKGSEQSYEQTLANVIARDEADSTRDHAPLKKATDAIEVDSSALGLEEVVAKMCAEVESRLGWTRPAS